MTMTLHRYVFAVAGLCAALAVTPASATVLDQINSHTASGKTVFVVLTDAAAKNVEGARAAAQSAQSKTPDSAVVELNRSDAAQRAAVAKYRVAGAPVPLVLVVAPNGLAVGAARPDTPDAVDRLVELVPTPAKADYISILSSRRVAMVVFSRASMPEQSPLFEQISAMRRQPNLQTGTVLVDLDSPVERRWIAQWKIDPQKVTRPLLIFVSPTGQILGRLEGAPTAEQMVQTARKQVKGCGCGNPRCKGHR